MACWVFCGVLAALAGGVAPLRPAVTIVGQKVSGGPSGPVLQLQVPAHRSSLLSTVQSVMSFGGPAGAPPPPPTAAAAPEPEPELVTASVPETALDLPQSPPTVSAAAADRVFGLSEPAHAFFGPEDAVTAAARPAARPAVSRRVQVAAPQYRRVISPARVTAASPEPTGSTETVTVSESLQCPQQHAFWPPTRQCVPIGKQGPCPEGSVIHVNVSGSAEVSCACLAGFLAWTDGRCFLRFTAGPCGDGGVICESESGPAECRCRSGFHKGRDGRCYQDYTQGDCPPNNVFIGGQCVAKGPCPDSFFMVFSIRDQKYTCGCPSGFLLVTAVNRCIRARTHCRHCVENLYRWPADGQYYRELTRGPCNAAELLLQTGAGPVCGCGKYPAGDRLAAFLEPTARWPLDGRCYRLYERAICPAGHWFIWSSATDRMPVCCPKGHFFWPSDGQCYEEFTRGPCPKHQLFINVLRNSVCTCDDQWGFTVLNQEDGTCYLRNTQGPCRPGFRFIGTSDGRKVCDCMPGEFYYEPTDKCYPLYQQGPCRPGQWLVFSAAAGRAVCRDSQCPLVKLADAAGRVPKARLLGLPAPKPLVYWKVTDRCYQIGSRDPCSEDFRLELDEYGITPVCQPLHETNREVPVQAPLNEMTRCPPGSYRAISRSCLPVLVTAVEPDTSAVCGEMQVWSAAAGRCQAAAEAPVASCPASYHPYPEGGECVCPRGQFPDVDGACRPSEHHGPGPLHWTIHNYQRKVEQWRRAAARRL